MRIVLIDEESELFVVELDKPVSIGRLSNANYVTINSKHDKPAYRTEFRRNLSDYYWKHTNFTECIIEEENFPEIVKIRLRNLGIIE